ncbi:MAG: hypothetical protein AAFY31_06585, partial [Pseudomonadota bacterium]
ILGCAREPEIAVRFEQGRQGDLHLEPRQRRPDAEMQALFKAHRDLRLASAPQYSDSYHFHKLDELVVEI